VYIFQECSWFIKFHTIYIPTKYLRHFQESDIQRIYMTFLYAWFDIVRLLKKTI